MAVDKLAISGDCGLSVFIGDSTVGRGQKNRFGRVSIPALDISLTFGTTSGKANKLYCQKRTLTATTYDLVDLYGSLTDFQGTVINFATIKLAVVAIVTPNGTKAVRVGPQNQTNAFAAPYGGVGATVYKLVTHWDLCVYEPVAGYAVATGSTDILPVYNPTGSSLDYWLLLAGT